MDQPVGDRRHARRHRAVEEHGITGARVRPGYEATVVDASADGVLVDCGYRLLPGTSVELQLETAANRIAIRGRVLRCAVAVVRPWAVVYRAAIRFERRIAWPGADNGKRVDRPGESAWEPTTHQPVYCPDEARQDGTS